MGIAKRAQHLQSVCVRISTHIGDVFHYTDPQGDEVSGILQGVVYDPMDEVVSVFTYWNGIQLKIEAGKTSLKEYL